MKRMLTILVALVVLMSFACTALAATTWDYTGSSLKQVVKSNTNKSVIDFTGDSGTYFVTIDFSAGSATEVIGGFCHEGNNGHIINYVAVFFDALAVPAADRGKALETVNKWNVERRYPRAMLTANNSFALDGNLIGTDNMTTDVVDEYVEDMIFGTNQFLNFLRDEGYPQFAAY